MEESLPGALPGGTKAYHERALRSRRKEGNTRALREEYFIILSSDHKEVM